MPLQILFEVVGGVGTVDNEHDTTGTSYLTNDHLLTISWFFTRRLCFDGDERAIHAKQVIKA